MKTRVNVYLSEEALELADRLAQEEGVSRSAVIDRSITQTQTPRANTNTNSPTNLPDGCKAMSKVEMREELHLFYKKLDHSLTEDRQELAGLIKDSHPDGE